MLKREKRNKNVVLEQLFPILGYNDQIIDPLFYEKRAKQLEQKRRDQSQLDISEIQQNKLFSPRKSVQLQPSKCQLQQNTKDRLRDSQYLQQQGQFEQKRRKDFRQDKKNFNQKVEIQRSRLQNHEVIGWIKKRFVQKASQKYLGDEQETRQFPIIESVFETLYKWQQASQQEEQQKKQKLLSIYEVNEILKSLRIPSDFQVLKESVEFVAKKKTNSLDFQLFNLLMLDENVDQFYQKFIEQIEFLSNQFTDQKFITYQQQNNRNSINQDLNKHHKNSFRPYSLKSALLLATYILNRKEIEQDIQQNCDVSMEIIDHYCELFSLTELQGMKKITTKMMMKILRQLRSSQKNNENNESIENRGNQENLNIKNNANIKKKELMENNVNKKNNENFRSNENFENDVKIKNNVNFKKNENLENDEKREKVWFSPLEQKQIRFGSLNNSKRNSEQIFMNKNGETASSSQQQWNSSKNTTVYGQNQKSQSNYFEQKEKKRYKIVESEENDFENEQEEAWNSLQVSTLNKKELQQIIQVSKKKGEQDAFKQAKCDPEINKSIIQHNQSNNFSSLYDQTKSYENYSSNATGNNIQKINFQEGSLSKELKPGSLEISKILSEKLNAGSLARFSQNKQSLQIYHKKNPSDINSALLKSLDRRLQSNVDKLKNTLVSQRSNQILDKWRTNEFDGAWGSKNVSVLKLPKYSYNDFLMANENNLILPQNI